MVSLTAPERETIVLFNDDSNTCSIYTCSRPVMTKLDRLCNSNPNTYKLIDETEFSKTYETKKNLISFRSPKVMSEEQRIKMSENAKERFSKKS